MVAIILVLGFFILFYCFLVAIAYTRLQTLVYLTVKLPEVYERLYAQNIGSVPADRLQRQPFLALLLSLSFSLSVEGPVTPQIRFYTFLREWNSMISASPLRDDPLVKRLVARERFIRKCSLATLLAGFVTLLVWFSLFWRSVH